MDTPTPRNVFSGASALEDFLNPERSVPLPLVELPASLNPFYSDRVHIYGKLAYLSPLFNIKLFASLNLLLEAQTLGTLEGVHTLVENSSGNKVLADAIVARMFGIKNVIAFVPRDIAPGKLEVLRLFGVKPEFSNGDPAMPSGIQLAREMGTQEGFFNPAQYENEANPVAYEKWLAPQIWEQTQGAITVFCAGLGTTGTLVGSSRYFKRKSPTISIVGVSPLSDQVPGVRSKKRLAEIKFDWHAALDHYVEVEARESFKKSLQLCRVGLLAGPSSGLALAGLLKFIEDQKATSTLDQLRNEKGEVVAVVPFPDSALLYLEKYSTHLDPIDLA
jgi:cysteine synthase